MIPKELVYITTVAEYGNISKAAERLFIAQSSLSRCILKLESDLGIELFKRTTEGLKPTFAGEYYIRNANKIIQLYKELETEFSHINEMNIGRLVVGTTTHLGSFVLPKLLATFTELFPKIELSIVESVSTEIENEILKGIIDIGILHSPISNPGLKSNVIYKEQFLLAVPPDDPINQHAYYKDGGKEPYIDIQLTANRPYILTHTSQRTRQVTTKILENANIPIKVHYLTKSIQTASRLVRDNHGFTLVPHSYCKLFGSSYAPNYYFIEDTYEPSWELVIAYAKDIPLSKAAKEFSKIALDILPQLYNFPSE